MTRSSNLTSTVELVIPILHTQLSEVQSCICTRCMQNQGHAVHALFHSLLDKTEETVVVLVLCGQCLLHNEFARVPAELVGLCCPESRLLRIFRIFCRTLSVSGRMGDGTRQDCHHTCNRRHTRQHHCRNALWCVQAFQSRKSKLLKVVIFPFSCIRFSSCTLPAAQLVHVEHNRRHRAATDFRLL